MNFILKSSNSLRNVKSTRHKHRNIVAIQQNLIKFRDAFALRRVLNLGDVLEQHVDKVIEAQQCSAHLLVVLHQDVNPRADAFVDEFYEWILEGENDEILR